MSGTKTTVTLQVENLPDGGCQLSVEGSAVKVPVSGYRWSEMAGDFISVSSTQAKLNEKK